MTYWCDDRMLDIEQRRLDAAQADARRAVELRKVREGVRDMERLPYCRVQYWRVDNDMLFPCKEEDKWDYCDITAISPMCASSLRFARSEETRIASALKLMKVAYESGQFNKVREIQNVLKVRGT